MVLAIIAIASAGAVLAIPDASETALERDAQRLAALFDSARAQSRASGLAVTWHTTADGFKFVGLPQIKNKKTDAYEDLTPFPSQWLSAATSVAPDKQVLLGPEPIIARQSVVLQNGQRSLAISTDGLRPFTVEFAPAKSESL